VERLGAATLCLGGDKGGCFDLLNRHHSHGQEVAHNADARWDMTIATPPASDAPCVDVEPLTGAALCDAERVEGCAKLVRSRGASFSKAGRCFLPFRIA
jgi:hypothetical protein